MTRVLLSTIGSRGDVQPLVALACELHARGQAVRLCVPPDFREWIEGLGLAVTPIGPPVRTFAAPRPATTPAAPMSPELRRQLVEASVATQFDTLMGIARDHDVIVAATALQVAARSVAEKLGIGYVFVAYSPTVLPSGHHAPPPLPPIAGQPPAPETSDNRELWARDAARFNDTFGSAVNARRAMLGLAAIDDVRSYMFTDRPWLAADPTLLPWPDGESAFQTGAWLLRDERPLPAELQAFLDAGDPPIYFGFGSTPVSPGFSHVGIESARALGRRLIVHGGWSDLSGVEQGQNCLTIGEVNMRALFPRTALVIHHGGAGTTTAAALAGTPQVVIPHVYDQHYMARRVQELGIGTAHAAGVPTTESLIAALERGLHADVAARARTVAAAVRTDGTEVAVERLTT